MLPVLWLQTNKSIDGTKQKEIKQFNKLVAQSAVAVEEETPKVEELTTSSVEA